MREGRPVQFVRCVHPVLAEGCGRIFHERHVIPGSIAKRLVHSMQLLANRPTTITLTM
jgi:hypothetical protein